MQSLVKPRKLTGRRMLAAAAAAVAATATMSMVAEASFSYTGTFQGGALSLNHVTNVTVEGLPDASLQPDQLVNFQTDDPLYSCLNGESINVWQAPSEFPHQYVVHNGWQGPQCAYGTWTFPLSYQASWLGNVTTLTLVANATVENDSDAKTVGQVDNFQTNDSVYRCLNGESINVFIAPSEYPGQYVVHNGLQGSQCAYGTWTFPAPQPTVSGVSPNVGVVGVSEPVVITGSGFSGTLGVSFSSGPLSCPAASWDVVNDGEIIATTPLLCGAIGTADVRVTAVGGTSAITSADQFNQL